MTVRSPARCRSHARARAWTFALLALVALVCAGPRERARASLVEAVDLETLVKEADEIVLARVIKQWSHYDERGRIVTDFQMQVEQTEKGASAPGAAVVVRRLGGVVGDVGMHISGEPGFEDGEVVLLFGARGKRTYLRPIGMGQGAVRIFEQGGERWARSDMRGAALVARRGSSDKARTAVPEPRRLDDLIADVRALVAKP